MRIIVHQYMITIPFLGMLFCLGGFLSFSPLQGQNTDIKPAQQIGLPRIQNFTPADYNAHPQNYGIAQDRQGLMYFANANGVLQYDGVNWRTISLPKGKIAYSVGCAGNDVVYVGGEGDIGYLISDGSGSLQFQSLLDKIPEPFQDFNYTWQIASTEAFVYFMTDKYLLGWSTNGTEDELKAWPFKNIYHTTHVIDDELYIWEWDKGLEKVVGDSLQVVPGGAAFAYSTIRIMASLEEANGKIFIGTVQKGFATYDGAKVERIETSPTLKELINSGSLSNSLRLKNGRFAFATLGGGIILTDSAFNILQVLDEETGLGDNQVTDLFIDRSGALWSSMYTGISRISSPSPFSFYTEKLGLTGHTQGVFHYKNHLYVYGFAGVFQLSKPTVNDTRTNFQFRKLFTDRIAITDVLEIDGLMLAASNGGITAFYPESGLIGDGQNYALKGASQLLRSRFRKDLFYAALGNSIGLFQKDREDWKFVGQIPGLPDIVNSIVETAPHQLWATSSDYATRISIEEEDFMQENGTIIADPERVIAAQLNNFDQSNGLPKGYVSVHLLKNEALFTTASGLYRFNSSNQSFESDFSLPYSDTTQAIIFMQVQASGNIWLINGKEDQSSLIQLKDAGNGQYTLESSNFQQFHSQGLSITGIDEDPDDENIAWISTSNGLIKYNGAIKKDYQQAFPVLIRRVLVNNDSLIYGGATAHPNTPDLAFAFNSMRFEYAAPSYDLPEKTQYQILLEGFDKNWSPWTTETKKDYTQLPEGNYTFRIKAKNIFGTLGEEGSYSFSIQPPWYRSWWAYLIYTILGLGALIGIVFVYNSWRTRRLKEQNLELEKKVAEQTEELRSSNEKLKELDQLKSEFFTNISHEFRTPLTVIRGMMNKVAEDPKKWMAKGQLIINRNSDNLLNLVNQILDLRKLESGDLKLNLIQSDIVNYLKYITESFHSYAESKDIDLHFKASEIKLSMDFDPEKLLRVISNLLSNALKFTPEGGSITLQADKESATTPASLRIQVKDTGIGIPEDKIKNIFDRFYQVDSSSTRQGEGTGIGLALTRELIQLMNGEIWVNSEINKGTTFTILLPIHSEAPHTNVATEYSYQNVIDHSLIIPNHVEIENSATPNLESYLPTLLIVEDNPDVMQYLISCLEGQFHMELAKDGQEGIEKALDVIPDIIISDLMMPKKNGFELCQALKTDERTSHIPIVLLTAKADQDSRITGFERGADDYLTKPFNKRELFARMNNLLSIRKKLQERYSSLEALPPSDKVSIQQEDEFILKVRNIIEENLDNENFGSPELCRAIAMSRSHLHRKIKALTNRSTSLYIRSVRLQKAKVLLQSTNLNISQVAFETGFNNPNYFSRIFSEEFGSPPTFFRK